MPSLGLLIFSSKNILLLIMDKYAYRNHIFIYNYIGDIFEINYMIIYWLIKISHIK